jgi:hypothetical protein
MEEVSVAEIIRLGSESLPAILDMPALEGASISAADVNERPDFVIARLARLGGGHGIDGGYWGAWLRMVRRIALDPCAVASGLEPSALSWLSMWCFASGEERLGWRLFEPLAQDPRVTETGGQLHHAAIKLCLLWQLHGGRAVDAARVGTAYLEKFGDTPEVQVLTGVARCLLGELPLDDARRVVFRLRPHLGGKFVDVVAPALYFLGDREAASAVLQLYNRETVFFPPIERVVSSIFGAELENARAQPAPPPLPRTKWRGLVLERSSRRTVHRYGPADSEAPNCPGCHSVTHTWFLIDVMGEKKLHQALPEWPSFPAVACLSCDYWMLRHDIVHRDDGRVGLIEVNAADSRLAKPRDEVARPTPQFAKTRAAPACLEDMPLEGDCQLGGNPAWIQAEEDVRCAGCDERMTFVLRFSSPNSFVGCPTVGNGSAALYFFACNSCRRSARIAQWT